MDFTGYMVHVWTVPGYESPEGHFSDSTRRSPVPTARTTRIQTREIGNADTTCLNA